MGNRNVPGRGLKEGLRYEAQSLGNQGWNSRRGELRGKGGKGYWVPEGCEKKRIERFNGAWKPFYVELRNHLEAVKGYLDTRLRCDKCLVPSHLAKEERGLGSEWRKVASGAEAQHWRDSGIQIRDSRDNRITASLVVGSRGPGTKRQALNHATYTEDKTGESYSEHSQ
ncbi:15554_t:CDS:2 [Acaulospora colombiana]|uniref:15554_t:CDS:1 n=1 Tax=Acaulospora colombiana TaxID=27376 RepID=A0ACA9MQX1_9GLOM|nr:15554_t:CDS:2 [Acaulospora colombiana]